MAWKNGEQEARSALQKERTTRNDAEAKLAESLADLDEVSATKSEADIKAAARAAELDSRGAKLEEDLAAKRKAHKKLEGKLKELDESLKKEVASKAGMNAQVAELTVQAEKTAAAQSESDKNSAAAEAELKSNQVKLEAELRVAQEALKKERALLKKNGAAVCRALSLTEDDPDAKVVFAAIVTEIKAVAKAKKSADNDRAKEQKTQENSASQIAELQKSVQALTQDLNSTPPVLRCP